ncbi:MAG: MFS transporter [Acidobacteria bacterium]|nr:MFS transporter [Acidobacteriota bacterium]
MAQSSVYSPSAVAAPALPWYRTITPEQWRVLLAAKLGWMLDAMDFMLYAMAIGQLRAYFGINDAMAGLLGTITLAMSACGGIIFGFVADRFGRTRALMATIFIFSLASLGASTSQTIIQLLMWRAILGIGMGGEWASGAVLVSETWPPAHRNKAISIMQSGWAIGYIFAAVLAGIFIDLLGLGDNAWRWLFAFGAVPALFTLWIRRSVPEPAAWTARRASTEPRRNPFAVIFGPTYRARTLLVVALNSAVQFGYWGIFFWLPSFLARPVEQGGAGMSVVGSIGWIIPIQIGAYLGYLTFGFIADRLGRSRTFILFMVTAALIVPIYGQMARSPLVLMLLGPLFGYAAHGYFSMFGGFIAELFPTAVRATGQGTSYNLGRLAGAVAPYTIGAIATLPGIGIGLAMATTSGFFLLAALIILTLPDRSGQELEA